jgi:hypothetical protein
MLGISREMEGSMNFSGLSDVKARVFTQVLKTALRNSSTSEINEHELPKNEKLATQINKRLSSNLNYIVNYNNENFPSNSFSIQSSSYFPYLKFKLV